MEKAPIKENEEERIKSLQKLKVLDTPPDEHLDLIAMIATKLFNMPISTISFVDSNREWNKAAYGTDKKEDSRENSFSGHALYADDVFIVPDTQKDPRFSDNPLVVGEPHIRSFAAAPIHSAEDHQAIGAFCIEGKEPKSFSADEIDLLKRLAKWVELELNPKSDKETKDESLSTLTKGQEAQFLASILSNTSDAIISETLDGIVTSWNIAAERLYGYSADEMIGRNIKEIIPEGHNDVDEIINKIKAGVKLENHQSVRKRKDGSLFHISLFGSPILNENKQVVGITLIVHDVTKSRESEIKMQEYMKELERFNKIMIDREIKMIELKKEIERLTPPNP